MCLAIMIAMATLNEDLIHVLQMSKQKQREITYPGPYN